MTDESGIRGTENSPAEQPSLIDTGKGFSVLYRDRYLYSRYDPSRNPEHAVNATPLRPETLVLCSSPVLGYALDLLLENIPTDCLVLALECDEKLMAFSAAHIPEHILKHPQFRYIRTSAASKVVEYIDGLDRKPFRRCVRLDLSGGSALNEEFYRDTVRLVDEYIQQYWRNHFTLMKLGRNYARNFFRNLPILAHAASEKQSTEKTVLIAGAGPSLDETIPFIKEQRTRLFILAVDTALRPLADSGITPDAVVLVESQFWIERAFTGFRKSSIPVIADLTARPGAITATGGTCSFFLSEYAQLRYIKRFMSTGIELPVIPPLGSVGLVALHLSQFISKPDAPVFLTGLDFSWGYGMTHSRGAPAADDVHRLSARLAPAGAQVPSLAEGVFSVAGKDGVPVFTDPALSGYARLCGATFSDQVCEQPGIPPEPRFIDLGTSGLETALARMSLKDARTIIERDATSAVARSGEQCLDGTSNHKTESAAAREKIIRDFLECEKEKMEQVRGLLTGEIKAECTAEILEREIREMDYLFAHFPDGYKGYSSDPAFLNRVRIELEYFLKTVRSAISSLSS